ncbi:MAG TPA: glycosyltransferase, partial [Thermoanaerobaculia bacterium]|nr:glycosyltransferase [Thermoanaerobaculia bacterium]
LAERFTIHPLRSLPERASQFDAVLYQLGNNADYHGRIYQALLGVSGVPGVVVLHEYVLHHLVRALTLDRGDAAGYLEEMRYAYGRSGLALGKRCLATGIPVDVWGYPLFERAVDAAQGVLVHSEVTRERVLKSRPLTRIARVPHHLSLDELPGAATLSREAAREALGLPQGVFLVASFGFITPVKRLDVALRAFARFHREVPDSRYLLVGDVSPYYDLDAVLSPELRNGVVRVGHTELPDFLRYMVASDLAVNLRYPSAGETSGTVVRLLGLGRAVAVSDDGSFAEIPDDCCAKVPLDDTEEETLLAYLRLLHRDPALRQAIENNARRHMAATASLESSALGYAELLKEVAASAVSPVSPALPFRAAPPLAPYPADDVLTDLIADLSAEAADLGIGEGDGELLSGLAEALVDLDLDLDLDKARL